MKKKSSVIILAAGKSSRMGTPKFLLKYDKDITFLEHIIKEYEVFGCKEINVILNKKGKELIDRTKPFYLSSNTKQIINFHPGWERFYSLKLGLEELNKKRKVFIHNVDNPFVNHKILSLLLENIHDYDYVVPTFNNRGGHPILISKKVLKYIIAENGHNLNLKDYLSIYKKKTVNVDDEKILINVNSKEDYNKLF